MQASIIGYNRRYVVREMQEVSLSLMITHRILQMVLNEASYAKPTESCKLYLQWPTDYKEDLRVT